MTVTVSGGSGGCGVGVPPTGCVTVSLHPTRQFSPTTVTLVPGAPADGDTAMDGAMQAADAGDAPIRLG